MHHRLATASRLAICLALALPVAAHAQEAKDPPKWDVSAPPGMSVRQVPITVEEGTWMNLDVSPDGQTVAFDLLGDIYTMPITGGTPTRISEGLPYETQPRFSPDGKTVVFEKDRGGYLSSPRASAEPGVYRVAATGGAMTQITGSGGNPQFGASNERVFVMEGDAKESRLVSLDLNGEARRVHAKGELVNDYRVSPDGRFLAFRQNYQAFVTPLVPGTQEVSLSPKGGALPVVKVSGDGADWIHWSEAGARVNWSLGPTVFGAATAALFADAPLANPPG